ncbi:hypothetical protein LAJ19_17880 (plasmid) [Deinococcus taeanensis]|uniref:hypothetical protein n=1 Tax=Deinococcus taeanensis TaxID=2737050 RepID=UPI001CDD871E|nr:hypothetical protein [Deinococcus taeanensis]UBV44999.1 hypothetical protein LAJ19_17880 [Deinococcus taeanensis]
MTRPTPLALLTPGGAHAHKCRAQTGAHAPWQQLPFVTAGRADALNDRTWTPGNPLSALLGRH